MARTRARFSRVAFDAQQGVQLLSHRGTGGSAGGLSHGSISLVGCIRDYTIKIYNDSDIVQGLQGLQGLAISLIAP